MHSFRRRDPVRSALAVLTVLGLVFTLFASMNVPQASAQTASVTANVHLCPYDLSGLSVYEIAPLCNAQSVGNTVTLDNGSGIVVQQATDGSGLTTFSNITAGISTFYLYPSFEPGYTALVAGCSQDDFLGNNVVPYQLMPLGGLWDVNFFFQAPDNMVYCDFFLYTPGVAPPGQVTYGDVIVNKITCPPGYDGYGADIYGLAQNCQDATQVVSFDLVDSLGNVSSATTPGQVVNTANWSGIPSGPLSITETSGEYYQPRVFCKNSKLTGEEDPETEVSVNATTAETELKSGYDFLYCDWFNIQYDPGYVTIIINKHVCPDEYYSSDQYELAQNCQEPYDPIEFKLDGASSGNPGTQMTGDVIGNGVQWSNLDGDTWYIQEFPPSGYGEPLVYCKLISNDDGSESSQDQVPVETTDDGYRIVRDVSEGYTLYCDWYNVNASPYVGIYIHKYGCPEAYQDDWGLQDWAQYCTTIVRDARFTVEYSDGSSYPQTLNGIDLGWERLAPGSYRISEQQPSGWTSSVVYCAVGSYSASTGEYTRVDISNGGFDWDLFDYEYLDCYWYNLPKPRPVVTVDPNAPATLIIVKYTCPEDYDPLQTNADPIDDCDDPTDGIEFSVVGANNQSISRETGDDGDGTVAFDGLKPGSYLLRETYPEDTENAFIWNCESDYRIFDYPFAPFARIDHTGTIKVSLVPGETLECSWFNVPSPPEEDDANGAPSGGEVDVTFSVYQCSSGALNPSACDPVGEGTFVSLSSVSGEGGPIEFETDDEGIASGSVDADEYDLDADDPVCFADSTAFTSDGTLDLTDGEPVDVSVYLCG